MDFVRLPLVAILGIIIFGESLEVWVFVGAAIIFSANYLNISSEARKNRRLT
jgi:drug/metabolite transporter (DMT)-like permease